MASNDIPAALASLIAKHSVPSFTPSDPEFETLRQAYLPTSKLPSRIIRPETAEQVAEIVDALATAAIPFTVRAGGHDLQSRSTASGAVQLDLRRMAAVSIAADRRTAWIGGGANLKDVLAALEPAGLTAPVGNYGSVGYVGWSTYGGYGPYSGDFGLGVDHIVGARVVLADGRLVDADERLLKGLRGGGPSNWGVVVELEIRVHETKQVQAGTFFYESSDLKGATTAVLTNFAALLEKGPLPSHMLAEPTFFNMPQGVAVAAMYVWNGPASGESKKWQDTIAGLGNCVMQQVTSTTPLGALSANDALLPAQMALHSETVSLSRLTPSAIAAIAEAAAALPRAAVGAGVVVHSLLAPSPSVGPREGSTFLCREPHFMVEIIGGSAAPGAAGEAAAWAEAAWARLSVADGAIDASYYPLTGARGDVKKIFGKHLDALVALKKEVDPNNILKYASPQLPL